MSEIHSRVVVFRCILPCVVCNRRRCNTRLDIWDTCNSVFCRGWHTRNTRVWEEQDFGVEDAFSNHVDDYCGFVFFFENEADVAGTAKWGWLLSLSLPCCYCCSLKDCIQTVVDGHCGSVVFLSKKIFWVVDAETRDCHESRGRDIARCSSRPLISRDKTVAHV